MSDIIPFEFEGNNVRVVEVDGEPWFVAKDVAEGLGYTWNGTSRISHVPSEWRGVTSVVTPYGNQEMAVLAEQGLYFFVSRSDKPKALPFQKWVSGEVLPSIRKTGSYDINKRPSHPALPDFTNPVEAARAWADQFEAREQAENLVLEQSKRLEEAAPKEEFVDTYCDTTELRGFRDVCNLLKVNEREFREFLVSEGYMYKKGRVWMPYKKFINKGYFKMVTGINHRTQQSYINAMFTSRGIVEIRKEWRRMELFGF